MSSCGRHGNVKETCGGGSKVQPAACASASEMPANQNATCAKAMPAADKDDRQSECAAGAVPGQIEDQGHRAGCRQFGQRHDICEPIECRKSKSLPRDDAKNEQAADRAEGSADHRVGYVAD